MDERVCASRCSSSRRCVARSMFSESEVLRASVLARVEGWAVVGAWVRPERRVVVERMSARSCFLERERVSMGRQAAIGEAALRLVRGRGWGRRTVYLPGTGAATGRPGLELLAGTIFVLAEPL